MVTAGVVRDVTTGQKGTHMSLKGKSAIVTGSTSGIGLGIAERLAQAGANVMLNGSRAPAEAEKMRGEMAAKYGTGIAYTAADMTKEDDRIRLVKETEKAFGQVDILVNNAGLSPLAPSSAETSEELFDKVVAVNFKGPFRLSALVAERMAAGDGGSVISISSTGALRPAPNFGPYAGSKAALNAISVAFAREFAPKVRFNVISPGGFYTDISKAWATPGEEVPTAPLRRFGYPDEIVTAALYYASDASSYTTGSLLRVDGMDPV
jgi:NAD(P)-dependent dehydrogenase (short-subunit alcohol dehydrogenase family)